MRVAAILCPLEEVPVDFLADPDGVWEFETLADAAGFEEAWGSVSIGALTEAYRDFPEGAAVVVLTAPGECAIALVDCLAHLERAHLERAHLERARLERRAYGGSSTGGTANDSRFHDLGDAGSLGNTDVGRSIAA